MTQERGTVIHLIVGLNPGARSMPFSIWFASKKKRVGRRKFTT